MARTSRNRDATRLNLLVDSDVRARMDALRTASGAESMAELIRRSLSVYDMLWHASRGGAEVLLRDSNGVTKVAMPEFEHAKLKPVPKTPRRQTG